MRQILQRAAIFAFVIAASAPSQASRPKKKVLFLTHSAGYVHDVVKRPAPDQLSFAEKELTSFAAQDAVGGIKVECTQDCGVLTAENLKRYDVVAFYTTGELPAPPGGAQALIDWVRAGGGFIGIHCAADTWYTVPAYGDMLGGVFESHPWNQLVRIKHQTGEVHEITDEVYQFKSFSPEPLTMMATLDGSSVDLTKGSRKDGNYALAWLREYGAGRVAYVALGHGEGAWRDAYFRNILLRRALHFSSRCFMANSVVALPTVDAKWLIPLPSAEQAEFTHRDGSAARWNVAGGAIQVVPGAGDVITKEKFGDFRLHLEFRVPEHPPEDKGQARGNSGVYLQDRYEIQILDSFGLEPKADDCGAIYGKKAPLTNACRKAGEWQSYDVGFKAARFDAAGKKIAGARASVWQNGLKIHDDVEIDGPTVAGQPETPEPGPLRLQDHGNLVAFRNVWVVPR